MVTVAIVCAVLACGGSVASAQSGSFTSLVVNTTNPSTGLPAGKLTFDHNGLAIEGRQNGTLFGKMLFSGNELSLIGYGDPPKVRLASDVGNGAVSFNWLRPDGGQEEVFLIQGSLDEQTPGSLGGQLSLFIRKRYGTGDSAMRLIGVITAAYTSNGQPRIRWDPNTVDSLEQLTPQNYGLLSSIATISNLSGSLSSVQYEDGSWLTAVNPNLDTSVSGNMTVVPNQSLRIQLRRTSAGGTAPYVYVYVDGVRVVNEYRPTSTSGEVITVPIASGGNKLIVVQVSAQTGTVEIGSLNAP